MDIVHRRSATRGGPEGATLPGTSEAVKLSETTHSSMARSSEPAMHDEAEWRPEAEVEPVAPVAVIREELQPGMARLEVARFLRRRAKLEDPAITGTRLADADAHRTAAAVDPREDHPRGVHDPNPDAEVGHARRRGRSRGLRRDRCRQRESGEAGGRRCRCGESLAVPREQRCASASQALRSVHRERCNTTTPTASISHASRGAGGVARPTGSESTRWRSRNLQLSAHRESAETRPIAKGQQGSACTMASCAGAAGG